MKKNSQNISDNSEDFLGIDDFFKKLNACRSNQQDTHVEEVDDETDLVIAEDSYQDEDRLTPSCFSDGSPCRDRSPLNNSTRMQSICCWWCLVFELSIV